MPDINKPFPVGWVNVYAELGVPAGTGLLIQNKDPFFDPLIRDQAISPTSPDISGPIAPYGVQFEVEPGSAGCWARGRLSGADGGPGLFLNVQVAT